MKSEKEISTMSIGELKVFVFGLIEENRSLKAENRSLKAEIRSLKDEIQLLKDELARSKKYRPGLK